YTHLGSDDFAMEEDAATTIGATSSPPDPRFRDTNFPLNVPFRELTEADFGESDEDAEYGAASRAPKLSNTDKTQMVLESMKKLSRFSLRMFLEELFTSEDSAIKNVTNTYLAQDGHIRLLNLVYTDRVLENSSIAGWIMSKATDICVKETSRLTDTARKGKFYEEAKSLRLPSNSVKVELLRSFSIPNLLKLYDSATPHLQGLLKAIIGGKTTESDEELVQRRQRNPDMGRTMITSMLLNLRSRETNLHLAMNSLLLWDGRVPKRLVQTLNHYAFCISYNYQTKAVGSVSKDSVHLARRVANDPSKIWIFPHDNFNWVEKAWETSATHGNVSHDQVSA
ncbi:hypothetical protein B0H13DRAFT_1527812, partial [Mycena leptocephala]